MRVLVAGWFGFLRGEATAGDLLAARTVCGWLDRAGVPYDVALSPAFPDGVRLDALEPAAYSHAVFTCGPAAGTQVSQLLDRFRHCVTIGIGVSVVDGTPAGFDVLIPRDRVGAPGEGSPDLAVAAAPEPLPPVVALVRAHPQPEHPDGRHGSVHDRLGVLLRQRDVAVLPVDTRVDPRELTNRTPGQVSAVLARADVVVTTRLHGLVLALRYGVPALAVDPVAGGAKVTRQAAMLGWPAALTEPELTDERFAAELDWCLSPAAAALARRCAGAAHGELETRVAGQLLAALGVA